MTVHTVGWGLHWIMHDYWVRQTVLVSCTRWSSFILTAFVVGASCEMSKFMFLCRPYDREVSRSKFRGIWRLEKCHESSGVWESKLSLHARKLHLRMNNKLSCYRSLRLQLVLVFLWPWVIEHFCALFGACSRLTYMPRSAAITFEVGLSNWSILCATRFPRKSKYYLLFHYYIDFDLFCQFITKVLFPYQILSLNIHKSSARLRIHEKYFCRFCFECCDCQQ